MKKIILRIILFIFIVFITIGTYFVIQGYNLYKKVLNETPIEEKINEVKNKKNYTTLSNVSNDFKNAIVAVEDHRFYKHNGIDYVATIKALFTNIIAKSYKAGGSTITQQLAKNLYFTQEKNITRKIAELFMAFNLEKELDKDEILELYINNIYYGSGYYDIRSASLGYFDKEPIDLTLDEASLLAGIPNAPSVYSLDVNPDLAYKRQKKVVSAMKEYEYINDEQYNEIVKN